LGMTFYYLLAGKPPFADGSLHQKIIWHQVREPASVSSLRTDVPPSMLAALKHMIAKEPAQRYQTPAEVAYALARWLEAPMNAPPADEMPELSRACLGCAPGSAPGSPSSAATKEAVPLAPPTQRRARDQR